MSWGVGVLCAGDRKGPARGPQQPHGAISKISNIYKDPNSFSSCLEVFEVSSFFEVLETSKKGGGVLWEEKISARQARQHTEGF